MIKRCSKCRETKSIESFHKNVSQADGYQNTCKACRTLFTNRHYQRDYREQHKEKLQLQHNAWYLKNKKRVIRESAIYKKEKSKTDINYRIARNLRSRLYKALKKNYKTGSAVSDLGTSIEEFKRYIELRFKKGMTWENYGQWHIDHIRPLALFNLSNPKELKIACAFTNLQPLWAKDNFQKGKRLEKN